MYQAMVSYDGGFFSSFHATDEGLTEEVERHLATKGKTLVDWDVSIDAVIEIPDDEKENR